MGYRRELDASERMKTRFLRRIFAISIFTLGSAIPFVVTTAFSAEESPKVVKPKAPHDSGTLSKIPPDPAPMVERKQWVFDLRYVKGDLFLLGVHSVDLGTPQATPRAMGRFAIELFEGPTLIERVRFDFPFLGAGELPQDGGPYAPRFEPKVTSRIGVMFPATTRGTRLELWDRASDQRWPLPWPPADVSASRATGDAG